MTINDDLVALAALVADCEQALSPSALTSDMRKAMSMDKEKKSVIPLPHPVHTNDI